MQSSSIFIGETMGISLTTASESGAILACIPVVSRCINAYPVRKTDKKTNYWNFGNFNWSYF